MEAQYGNTGQGCPPRTARFTEENIENLNGFQNLDTCDDWMSHAPPFEWTSEDLYEFERAEEYREQEAEAMFHWWEAEGVRCATFGRNPNENPYKERTK